MRPLAVIGNVNVDMIMGSVAPWPQPGTEVMVAHDDLRVGGAAGNTALAWQAMGVEFQCAANLGSGPFGAWLGEAFPAHAPHWPVSQRRTTLSVGLSHPDGERTFFTTDGHLRDMTAEGCLAVLDGAVLRGGVLLLCGAFVTEALADEYGKVFDWADAHGIDVALDTGWPPDGWTDAIKAKTLGWLEHCKIALLNEVEAIGLTGTQDVECSAVALCHAMPAGTLVVIKRGSLGALGLDATGAVHHAAARSVTVVDTVGAGDIFNAGFLAAHARALPLAGCLGAGIGLASVAISTDPRRFIPLEQDLTA